MKRLMRPMLVLLAAAVLVVAGLLFRLEWTPADPLPQPLAVADGDQEIVWLAPATTLSGWERFVAAVRRSGRRLQADMPDLEVQLNHAYPPRSTDVPEVALTWKNTSQRLVFRWYKVTSRWKTADWVDALLTNRRPPLAIIGGSSSEAAWVLAGELNRHTDTLPPARQPVLLLTTATADRVSPREAFGSPASDEERVPLTSIYPDRTFRFCFTNKQMAFAVTRFIWSRPNLRIDADPVYVVQWEDDSYSYDLSDSLLFALKAQAGQRTAADLAFATTGVQAGNPAALLAGFVPWDRFRAQFPKVYRVPTSVGAFHLPNRYEAEEAEQLSQELMRHPEQRRPLLLVTGQAQPCRRFLNALYQLDPDRSRRLVVATGDAIAFNNVYRDRRTFWPIQDIPMSLVFFCHCNPIDRQAGFRPTPEDIRVEGEGWRVEGKDPSPSTLHPPPEDEPLSSTGTEDILLNADIVETVARAFAHGGPCADAGELTSRLGRVRIDSGGIHLDGEGEPFFASRPPYTGNRRSATGEHVVHLQPIVKDGRVLPRARLDVWKWQPTGTGMAWKLVAPPLVVSYDPPLVEGGVHR